MSGEAIRQTPDGVRRLSARAVRTYCEAITWMAPPEKRALERMMLEILPRWDAYLHELRLEKFASGQTHSGDVRANGVMLLSNMLMSLVRNTTVENHGEDREAVLWETAQKLNGLILENVKPGH